MVIETLQSLWMRRATGLPLAETMANGLLELEQKHAWTD